MQVLKYTKMSQYNLEQRPHTYAKAAEPDWSTIPYSAVAKFI